MSAPSLDRLIFKTSRLAEFCPRRNSSTRPGMASTIGRSFFSKSLSTTPWTPARKPTSRRLSRSPLQTAASRSAITALASRLRRSRRSSTSTAEPQAVRPLQPDARRAGQRLEDVARHALRPRPRVWRHDSREPRRRSQWNQFLGRSDTAGTQARPHDRQDAPQRHPPLQFQIPVQDHRSRPTIGRYPRTRSRSRAGIVWRRQPGQNPRQAQA